MSQTDRKPSQTDKRPRQLGVVSDQLGDEEWDLAIIGSGSAAFAAAIKATEAGARVVMVERGTPGGTCVNVGCVPSKALLAATETYHRARHHEFAGVPHLDDAAVDLAALVAQKDELVGMLRQAKYLDLVDDYGFTLRRGSGRFVDAKTLEVDGEPLRAVNYLIATGAHPSLPPIDGLVVVDYLTSTTALELTEIPRDLTVIGGGYVGCEFAQMFSRFGSQVTIIQRAPRLLRKEEPEISAAIADIFRDGGATVIVDARIEKVIKNDNGVSLEGELGETSHVEAERVLVATGRAPNTETLNLAAAGVEVGRGGFVIVDEFLRTTNSRIWAAGDVTASPQFVYVAASEGALAAENAFSGLGKETNQRSIPRVTFTAPQIAAVGMTEAEAVEAGHDAVTAVLPLSAVPRAIVNRETRGLIKLVAERATGRLLGVHMLADGAGDVIQAGVYALMAEMTTAEMAGAFHPYLTMAEGLKLAAQTFDKDVSKLSCCAA